MQIPCPYCGCVGYHTWAGTGGCPGAANERERDQIAAATIRAALTGSSAMAGEIAALKALCLGVANTLEIENRLLMKPIIGEIIAELRKAAQ